MWIPGDATYGHGLSHSEATNTKVHSGKWPTQVNPAASFLAAAVPREDPLVAVDTKDTALKIGWCWDETLATPHATKGFDTVIQYREKGTNAWTSFYAADHGTKTGLFLNDPQMVVRPSTPTLTISLALDLAQ